MSRLGMCRFFMGVGRIVYPSAESTERQTIQTRRDEAKRGVCAWTETVCY